MYRRTLQQGVPDSRPAKLRASPMRWYSVLISTRGPPVTSLFINSMNDSYLG